MHGNRLCNISEAPTKLLETSNRKSKTCIPPTALIIFAGRWIFWLYLLLNCYNSSARLYNYINILHILFFYKNIVYKNIQAQIRQKIKNILGISSASVLTIVFYFCFFFFQRFSWLIEHFLFKKVQKYVKTLFAYFSSL